MSSALPVLIVAQLSGVPAAPLSLEELRESVRNWAPQLQAQRALTEAAEGKALAAEGAFDPRLRAHGGGTPQGYYQQSNFGLSVAQLTPFWGAELEAGYRRGDGRIEPYEGQRETLDGGELALGLRVPLWRDRAIDDARAGRQSARAKLLAQRAKVEAQSLKLTLEAEKRYFALAAAWQRRHIAAGLLNLAERRDAQLADRVAEGAIPAIQRQENRRAILLRRAGLVKAERSVDAARIALSLYLRDDDGEPVLLTQPRYPTLPDTTSAALPDLEAERVRARSCRPELEMWRAQAEAAGVELSLAENRVAPKVELKSRASIDLGSGDEDERKRLDPAEVKAGLSFELPLLLRKDRGKRDAAAAQLVAVQAEARLAADVVSAQVRDAHSALQAAFAQLEIAREGAEVAELVADGERTRFELGATDLLIVNLREKAAADAQAALVDAQARVQIARARLRAAVGGQRRNHAEESCS